MCAIMGLVGRRPAVCVWCVLWLDCALWGAVSTGEEEVCNSTVTALSGSETARRAASGGQESCRSTLQPDDGLMRDGGSGRATVRCVRLCVLSTVCLQSGASREARRGVRRARRVCRIPFAIV